MQPIGTVPPVNHLGTADCLKNRYSVMRRRGLPHLQLTGIPQIAEIRRMLLAAGGLRLDA